MIEGTEMGKKPSSPEKIKTFNFLENDKIMTIFAGYLENKLLYFKITSLQESRVFCIGEETWRMDARHVQFELSPIEFLNFARCGFKSNFFFKSFSGE